MKEIKASNFNEKLSSWKSQNSKMAINDRIVIYYMYICTNVFRKSLKLYNNRNSVVIKENVYLRISTGFFHTSNNKKTDNLLVE